MTIKVNQQALAKAVDKWEADVPIEFLLSMSALRKHMLEENGVSVGSWIGLGNPIVVDEKKYTMFLLRYSS